MTHDQALSLWHQALTTEFGLAICAAEADLRVLMNELYEARQGSGDESLSKLSVVLPGEVAEVWLCKKEVELEP